MESRKRLTEPFSFPGGPVGCLLIHGFTGSPSEMRFLGNRLAAAGMTVLGIRLPGHGTTPEDMAQTRWEDWVGDAEAAAVQLGQTCQKVIGIGLSMGGLLALHLAAMGRLDGVVAMNAPMILQDWRTRFAHIFKPFIDYVEKPSVKAGKPLQPDIERFVYQRVPVPCLDSLHRGIRCVRRELGKVECPALLMQSMNDQTINPKSVKIIEEKLKQIKPEIVHWQNSGHILTLGPERAAVAETVEKFVQRITQV